MIIINGMRVCSPILLAADLAGLLDQLRLGTTGLTVPLVDDVVQVGIGGDFETATLVVTVTSESIRARRADGGRLQVHIVEDWADVTAPGVAFPVFDEPVKELVLERRGGRWAFGPGMCARRSELDRFVGTLTRFALAKQFRVGGFDQAVGAA